MQNVQSPRTDDAGVEQLIQAKGKTAARVTPDDIENSIACQYFFTAAEAVQGRAPTHESLGLLTFCVLVLNNGFTVSGESACASPKNFDEEIGRKVARQNATQKIWPLLGYELRTKLHQQQQHAEYTQQRNERIATGAVPAPHSDLSTTDKDADGNYII